MFYKFPIFTMLTILIAINFHQNRLVQIAINISNLFPVIIKNIQHKKFFYVFDIWRNSFSLKIINF